MSKRQGIMQRTDKGQRIVQVPMSLEFIAQVDRFAKARRESRAAFIRHACERFMAELRERELEAAYERGYREHPEELAFAQTAVRLTTEILPDEDWSDEATSPEQA